MQKSVWPKVQLKFSSSHLPPSFFPPSFHFSPSHNLSQAALSLLKYLTEHSRHLPSKGRIKRAELCGCHTAKLFPKTEITRKYFLLERHLFCFIKIAKSKCSIDCQFSGGHFQKIRQKKSQSSNFPFRHSVLFWWPCFQPAECHCWETKTQKMTVTYSMTILSSCPVRRRGKMSMVEVQYHTWALRWNVFCLCHKSKTEQQSLKTWGLVVGRQTECLYPINSSLISGMPCARAKKLPSYEVRSSVARYVCQPKETFFVFCQRLLIRCTRRCTCGMCICVGMLVFVCVNDSRFYFMGLPALQRVQTSRHLGNIWSEIKVAQTENTWVLAVGNTLLILRLIPNNDRSWDSLGHLCFLFYFDSLRFCCCHFTSCHCPCLQLPSCVYIYSLSSLLFLSERLPAPFICKFALCMISFFWTTKFSLVFLDTSASFFWTA